MAERRASLLDFAIAASVAVVPVMLGIVALVAWVRPADPESAWRQGRDDRYVSVRHVAALKTFERAIVQRPRPAAGARAPPRCSTACRHAGANGARAAGLPVAAPLVFDAPPAPIAGRADRRAAQRARRGAAALQHARERPRRAPRRLRRDALVCRRARGAGDADRVRCRARAAVPCAMCRPRRRARRLASQRWPHARSAGMARQRRQRHAGALARRPGDADRAARRDAPQSLGWRCGLHLFRPAASAGAGAALFPRRRAQRAAAPVRDTGAEREYGRNAAERIAGRAGAVRPGRRPALDGAAVAAHLAAAARVAAPADGRALPRATPTPRPSTTPLGRPADARGIRNRAAARRHGGRRRLFGRPDDRSPSCRRWRRRPRPATPAGTTSAARSACAAPRTATSRSASSCSRARWCAWRRSRSSTSRAAASRRWPARCRRARARRSTVPGAIRRATRACRTRCSTGPTRCSTRRCSTTRCRPRRSSRSWRRRSCPTPRSARAGSRPSARRCSATACRRATACAAS